MEPEGLVVAPAAPVAHESRIAGHLARQALLVSPLVVLGCGLLRGVDGAISAAIGLVLVSLNFLVSAWLISWGAKKGAAFLQGAILGGFLVRLAALLGIVLLLEPLDFIDVPVLVLTVAVTHIGLLIWETRYVSLTLAAPGLKPGVMGEPEEKE